MGPYHGRPRLSRSRSRIEIVPSSIGPHEGQFVEPKPRALDLNEAPTGTPAVTHTMIPPSRIPSSSNDTITSFFGDPDASKRDEDRVSEETEHVTQSWGDLATQDMAQRPRESPPIIDYAEFVDMDTADDSTKGHPNDDPLYDKASHEPYPRADVIQPL